MNRSQKKSLGRGGYQKNEEKARKRALERGNPSPEDVEAKCEGGVLDEF